MDGAGNVYVSDNSNNRIRKITAAGVISTYAGNGTAGFSGDSGPATRAELNGPTGVRLDAAGNLYISDSNNSRVRKVTPGGIISTFAGTGTGGYNGDGIAATSAELNDPNGIATDASGNVYIADFSNHRVRKVNAAGIISTIAGDGTDGFSGDGGPAIDAEFNSPTDVALDGSGNVYITDNNNDRIRKVDTSGIITTFAGTGYGGYNGDGIAATTADLYAPDRVAVDSAGNVYISEYGNNRIRKVNSSGIISTIAGNGTQGFGGDGGLATRGEINTPRGLAVESNGGWLFLSDAENNRVREVQYQSYTPVFSLEGGTYSSAQTVTITDTTPGVIIYYTTNGTTPTAASTKYTGPIPVSATETVEAIAVSASYSNSAIATAKYVIETPAAAPVFSVAAGTYAAMQTVAITDATAGAVIHYTTNGTTPTAASAKYSAPIAVSATETIEAIAVATGYAESALASAKYVIETSAATPVFAPPAGTYTSAQKVTITSSTPGAVIYCALNGATPTSASTKYSTAITVAASEIIECLAVAPGYNNSVVAAAKYVIETPAATPVLSVKSGTYESTQTLAMTDATAGAILYYTTNGTTPTTASAKYTGPIAVDASETVTAIAVATGYTDSATASATYTLVGSPSALSSPATAIATPEATLNAYVNTFGLAGSYYFQYGTSSTALTSTTAKTALSAVATPVAAAAKLTTLKTKTTYYYQVVLTTAGGTAESSILSFTTN